MAEFFDSVIGIYHFLSDRTPKKVETALPRPRHQNRFSRDGTVLVSKVQVEHDLMSSVTKCLELIGGLEKAISRGDRVMVKPNFNSPDPYPASTDLDFLKAVVRILAGGGAKVTVGDSAGGMWRPTRKVLEKLGVLGPLAEMGAEVIAFDDRPEDWVRVKIDGDYLHEVTVPRSAYEANKIVYLPCLKTHRLGRFSMSLKLAVGFLHPGERRALHVRNLEQKAAELNLVWQPDLIIMDGRKAFVSAGPERGELVEPGVIIASGDMVAIDVEGLKILGSYPAKNRLMSDPYDSPQIATALKHGLGAREYEVVA